MMIMRNVILPLKWWRA